MEVKELTSEQFEELKENYFWQLMDNDDEVLEGINYPFQIPDEVIIEHYSGISFVNDDFACTAGK